MARLGSGETGREAAGVLSVAPSSVVKWSQHKRATGSAAPGKIGGHVPRRNRGEPAVRVRGLVAELAERGLRLDYRTRWNFAHSEGLSFEKTVLASAQDRPDVARKRLRWKAYQGEVDLQRLTVH